MRATGIWIAALALLFSADAVHAGGAVTYDREGLFFRDSGAEESVYDFDDLSLRECVDARFGCTRLPGVAFRSNSSVDDGYVVAVQGVTGPNSEPFGLRAGPSTSSTSRRQAIRMDFDRPQAAVGFWVTSLPSRNSCAEFGWVRIRVTFTDGSAWAGSRAPMYGILRPTFFGIIGTTRITSVVVTSGERCWYCGAGAPGDSAAPDGCYYEEFQSFGIDDLTFVPGPLPVPICRQDPTPGADARTLSGSVHVDAEATGGLERPRLAPGSVNLLFTGDPTFVPGDPASTFGVRLWQPGLRGVGTVIGEDRAGGSCTLAIDLRPTPASRHASVELFRGGDARLEMLRAASRSSGTVAASATRAVVEAIDLPPGYAILEPDRGIATCDALTVETPYGDDYQGLTYTTGGHLDTRLRLLAAYSTDEGTTFPPLIDVTEKLERLADSRPAEIRLTGRSGTGTFRAMCAVLVGVDCGDGTYDGVDEDSDGSPLCDAGVPVDCSDQIAAIHPGAVERCNGLDDDCDGTIDETCSPIE